MSGEIKRPAKTPPGTGKKICIMVEEGHGTDEFKVYMDGDIHRLKKGIPSDFMTPAEFWATNLFNICLEAMKQAGAIRTMERRK